MLFRSTDIKQSLDGNIVEVKTHNPETKDTQYKLVKNDGTSFTLAEDGSIIFTTATKEGDPKTGRFDVRSQGSTRFKIGESLFIEVENKHSVNSGTDGDSSTAKALSIVVYGNVDIVSHAGEINAKAKNINLTADNEINLKAGSTIRLTAGEGTGQNKPSGNTEAEKDHGGVVEIQCGDFVNKALTNRKTTSMDYKVVEADGGTFCTDTKSNYGYVIPGTFTMDIAQDYYESVGGKKRTDIKGGGVPTLGLFKEQSDGWEINAEAGSPTGSGENTVIPNAVSINSTKGGFKFESKSGDVDIYTETGYWGMGSETSVVAGLTKQYKDLKPGAYFGSKFIVKTRGILGVSIYSKSEEASVIKVDPDKITIKNPSGIYLN